MEHAIFFAFQLLSFVHSFIAPCRHNQFHRKSPTYGISSPSFAVCIGFTIRLDCLTVFSLRLLHITSTLQMHGVGFEICYLANIFLLLVYPLEVQSIQNVTHTNNQKGKQTVFSLFGVFFALVHIHTRSVKRFNRMQASDILENGKNNNKNKSTDRKLTKQ